MIAVKVAAGNLPATLFAAVCMDVADGLTATGTGQSTAYEVTCATNSFTTVAAGTGAVLYSAAVGGDDQVIFNGGANPLLVYPQVGAKINKLTANLPMQLAVNTGVYFRAISTTQWVGVLSA